MSGVVVFVLHHDGAFHKSSLGMLSEAARVCAELGRTCDAVVVGPAAELPRELCARLGEHGAKRVLRVDGPAGLGAPVVDAMAAAIAAHGHSHALMSGGVVGSEAGAGLAARLDAGICVEATGLRVDGGELVAERLILGDTRVAHVRLRSQVGVVVGRVNAFDARAAAGAPAEVEDLDVAWSPQTRRATMTARAKERMVSHDLEDAEVVVAGGRGLGEPDGFRALEALAEELGGVVGATRAVVDAGWYPYEAQVGQTGKTVSPRLYIAAGISGAVQHRVGMERAENIVAINSDARAPILGIAHLGVVGDLRSIVPRLTATLRQRRGARGEGA